MAEAARWLAGIAARSAIAVSPSWTPVCGSSLRRTSRSPTERAGRLCVGPPWI
jgi:hypothetical protein